MLFIVRPFLVPLDFLSSSEELVSQKAAGNAVAIVTIALIVHRGSVEAAAVATAWFTTRGQPQLSVLEPWSLLATPLRGCHPGETTDADRRRGKAALPRASRQLWVTIYSLSRKANFVYCLIFCMGYIYRAGELSSRH
ncbi:hypothetical protein CTAM01_14454 [Colletotrichum tamarilloi]|uniref:Uncharacterized protein n=1 Tax=Colletotrichum tamarilloi TaxID=1209934 RepID=A0ABQ9QP50_9PEZI|nr:uncharacterized protein CTAM01_14454 [Colletotrichum tamarilloi]KAK1480245.1 hypothetical protein CTAM01_14454 [Colletotrichum tamarilloi]